MISRAPFLFRPACAGASLRNTRVYRCTPAYSGYYYVVPLINTRAKHAHFLIGPSVPEGPDTLNPIGFCHRPCPFGAWGGNRGPPGAAKPKIYSRWLSLGGFAP